MTQVTAVLLISNDVLPNVLFSSIDIPVECWWACLPKQSGYWTFRGDMFGSDHALVGDYSPTTANDLAGFGMAIPDGLLGMAPEPWIHGDIIPAKLEEEWRAVSDEYLVAYLYQSPDQLDAAMCITRYDFLKRRWRTPNTTGPTYDIIVAWRALPEFPVGMLA